jgi:transcription initiation factor TFIID TATA-box-binding protein
MKQFPFKIENVVSFVVLQKPIPLNKLVSSSEDAEYEPEQFPGVIYRITQPRAAALIFSSGKIVCTGAKNIEMSKKAVEKIIQLIRQAGIDVPPSFELKIENIVASTRIKGDLKLAELTLSLENAEYEPEQIPGVIYRINSPLVTFLIFSTGKIICTGAKTTIDLNDALWKLKAKLETVGVKDVPIAQYELQSQRFLYHMPFRCYSRRTACPTVLREVCRGCSAG